MLHTVNLRPLVHLGTLDGRRQGHGKRWVDLSGGNWRMMESGPRKGGVYNYVILCINYVCNHFEYHIYIRVYIYTYLFTHIYMHVIYLHIYIYICKCKYDSFENHIHRRMDRSVDEVELVCISLCMQT